MHRYLPCSAVNLRRGREANLVNMFFYIYIFGRQRHEGVCLRSCACFVCLFGVLWEVDSL